MEINPLFLLLGGLGVMFFGYFFGLFEGRGQGYKKRRAEEGTEEKQPALERAVQSAAPLAPTTGTAPGLQGQEPAILRLDDQGGRLTVELDGTRLNPDGCTPVQRKRLIEVVTRLRPWIEGKASAAAPAAPAAANPPTVSPARSASLAPQSPIPAGQMAPAVAAAQAEDEPPPRNSMVSQIDEILQKNIAGTELAGRGLRLIEAPGGGVTVFIGLERYNSIGDVTDPDIQAALRKAVATWEKKYTPGA